METMYQKQILYLMEKRLLNNNSNIDVQINLFLKIQEMYKMCK